MSTNKARALCALLLVAVWRLGSAVAQDPLVAAPEMYKLLFENERVRVMEVTFEPGQKIARHSHPDHYVYVAEGGTLRISHPEGDPADVELKVGQVIWIAAETHWAENVGTTKIRLVVNELKASAPKPATAP